MFVIYVDVHLDCEARIARFLGTPDSILYSYGLSTMFSAIPAFCKKGDVVIVWVWGQTCHFSHIYPSCRQIAKFYLIVKLGFLQRWRCSLGHTEWVISI